MKKSNKIIITFIVVTIVLYYTLNINKFNEEIIETGPVSEITFEKKLKINNDGNITSNSFSNVKVKKNNIIQKEINTSVDIDKMFISMMSIDENLTDLVKGNSIEVKNFYDEQKLLSWFTPYFSDEYIVGVSISRVYQVNQEVGRMIKVDKKWTSYPPVTLSDSISILIEKYPSFNFNSIEGFFYLDDRVTPYYLFETLGEEKSFYLVNAYNKNIMIKKSRILDKEKEEDITTLLDIDIDGLLHIKEEFFDTLSKEEKIKIKQEIAETNDYIEKGLMKFDEDMNLVLDKRPLTGVSVSRDTLSSDQINSIIEDNYDNVNLIIKEN